MTVPSVPRHAVDPQAHQAALVLRNVEISFVGSAGARITVADDLNLAVGPGDLYCIVGRSGSGKTSILRTAAALHQPTGGTVHWFGSDVSGMSVSTVRNTRRARIGYSDQASAMIPDLTSVENVLIPLLPDGSRAVRAQQPRAEELLDKLGLAQRRHHLPHQLSGGERQRVALARGLIHQPDILIADEPTASLDRQTADATITLLVEYARQHTVLTASHDPHLAAAATDTLTLEPDPA